MLIRCDVFTESDVYEDPAVLYEGVGEDPDPVNLHNYLVVYRYAIFSHVQWVSVTLAIRLCPSS